jgi:hypothetical protein
MWNKSTGGEMMKGLRGCFTPALACAAQALAPNIRADLPNGRMNMKG